MRSSTSSRGHVAERRHQRGLIDTSVVIDLGRVDPADLPSEIAVSAVTPAELTAGPHATGGPHERAPTPGQAPTDRGGVRVAARAYGRVYAAVGGAGRKARDRRPFDLLIAATALAAELPLYTRNPSDFQELDGLLEIVPVPAP